MSERRYLTPADRELLDAWNRTTVRFRPEATVHALFREGAGAWPDRIALAWHGGQLTYAELDRRSDALAARLIEAGVPVDAPVALCMARCPEAIVAALAVLKAGAAYLPLDPDYPRSRLEFAIGDAGATVLLTEGDRVAALAGLAATTIAVDLRAPLPQSLAAPAERTGPSGRAYVMYTSGSTGTPKGVQIEHRAIVRLVGRAGFVRLDESTCFLHAAPLGFDASTLELWGPLLNGGRVAICRDVIPSGPVVAGLVAAYGVNTAWLTAALFNAIVDDDPAQLRGIRQLLVGGEALSIPHVRRALAALPETELINGYGPTECTTFTTTYSIPRALPADAGSVPIGRPIADTQVFVLDAAGELVPIGSEGELHVAGAGLARGYLGRPDLDAERFSERPAVPGVRLYRTGDMVRWLPDGVLEFVGRVDQQVKVRGFRIELGEIEARLAGLPGVRSCAVVARTDGGSEARLVAYVVGSRGELSVSGLRDALSGVLPDFMVPAAFVFLDALPVTPNGKLDRAALPAPAATRPSLAEPYRAPRGEREPLICAAYAEVLGLDRVGALDGFFELGGSSLDVLRLLRRLHAAGLGDIAPTTLFAAPTPAALARALGAPIEAAPVPTRAARDAGDGDNEPIAIIGMAGRFPGATDVESFWQNLCAGRESIRVFRPDELDPSIPVALRGDPAYVPARGVLDDVALFDAGFFGISPLEAQLTDPQHRHFLEVSWHALENAGYVPEHAPGPIGIFGGMYNASYFQRHLAPRPDVSGRIGELQLMLGNEKDYLTSRVAHKLGLSGPAISVNTACSTSLVAATMAMGSLRARDCDIALAGGVAITCPPNSGHLYQEGAMASVDGHTRPFDAKAMGTVFSDGVAIVVLRRLRDAIAAGDTIYAVLLGAAVNNDGSNRASFTAPSPEGQAAVISAAHAAAGIDARTISYVEAHGTATPLGDPIEIEGLTRAFRRHTDDCGFCAVGSLKSNVGHMVIAAGAASLIKASLSLHREALPPSIGYEKPNPQIDFGRTPFHVQEKLTQWRRGDAPRRAAVSSFGFGGTNAHVVLEEAPLRAAAAASTRANQLLLVSARSAEALAQSSTQLAEHLAAAAANGASPDELADVAHTLRVGRRAFGHRRWVVATSHAQAAELLRSPDAARTGSRELPADLPDVAFLCPGQGSQYAAMGRGLHASEPAFRLAYDECCEIIERLTGEDPRGSFFSDDPAVLVPTSVTQPAIFCLEYSLARLWMSWGVEPGSLIGHSVGEFVCAALAGVMRLEDALALVLERGRRMQALQAGSMLSVRLSAAELTPRLPDDVVIAAENAPGLCVASGPADAVSRLESELVASGVAARRLVTSHAFHSAMMDPVVEPMAQMLATMELHAPKIPILSTVTATWLEDSEARSPDYWAAHLRRPVRFGPAVARLLADPRRLLIEVGPRATLTALAQQAPNAGAKRGRPAALPCLGDSVEREDEALAAAVGKAWSLGVAIDWRRYVSHEQRRRVPLPGYAFQRQRYWVDAPSASATATPDAQHAPGSVAEAHALAAPAAASAPAAGKLLEQLRHLVEDVSGIDVSDADPAVPWLELGLDSLTLTQLALQLQRSFGVKVTFRQVMEDYPSLASLVALLEAKAAPASTEPTPQAMRPPLALSTNEDEPAAGPVAYDVKKAFGAIARIHTRADELTPQQRAGLDALVARYTKRTARSKAYTAEHRPHMADPRVVNGFRPLTKELTYQLVIERSRGSRVWDIDGNEYIDVLQGFGMSLFGWQPDFLREAIHRQVDLGYEIGPQHVLAGDTARLFCAVTGAQRAAFCNTGSEAVMGAMRIARTVTGRSTIAIFTGAYHGIFDEVIVRGSRKLKTTPAAPGILPESSQNMLVLDYGTPESLEILKQRADSLAAIVVEPVQSRRPDFQPVEFLRQLRELTEQAGIVLVFDEVVTGFRSHQRGAQGLFGIEADLGTYGKVVGGGLPIGVIAGKSRFMDALDGGQWQYGDASIPTVGVTYFAGTFVRHPLALAAAKASLEHMLAAGPALQKDLTARTAEMVAQINAAMVELGAPFKLNTFASLWRNVFTEDLPYADLMYAMLRDRGIHILDNFPCFLTTSHTDADIAAIVRAYREAAAEMQAAGFFPVLAPSAAVDSASVASTEPQREVWLADRLGPQASLAYNESISLHLRGELDVGALRHALRDLIARHDALRATFSEDGTRLRIPDARATPEFPLVDLSGDPSTADAKLAAIGARHVREPFDLEKGPLVRAELVRLAPDHHALVLTGHHIVLDGWSFWVLVKDLAALYGLATGARTTELPPAPSFVDYAANLAERANSPEVARNVAWWRERFADGGPTLSLPTDRPRPRVRTQASRRHDHDLSAQLIAQLRKLGASHRASLFATLLAGFGGLLNRLTGQNDVVVGIAAAGQAAAGLEDLVGHCVSTLPLRLAIDPDAAFADLLATSRVVLLDAYDHQDVTFSRVLQALPIARDPGRLPLVSVLFNIDQALASESMAMPGIHLELASNPRVAETFELFVNAVDRGAAGMRLECQYNSVLFDESTVARWMGAFEELLAAAVREPATALGRLPILTATDRAAIALWNRTDSGYPRDARIESLVAAQVARTPGLPAVHASDRTLTYAELGQRVERVAVALGAAGVHAGDRVGLLVERDSMLLPAMLGTLRAGAAYVPLDPAFPAERLSYMIADAGMKALATTSSLAAAHACVLGDVRVVTLDRLDEIAGDARASLPPGGSAGDEAYLIYTSGSTGKPKGVKVSHGCVVNFLHAMQDRPGLASGAKLAAVTTISFDIAVLELLLPLSVGAQVVLATREQATDGHALRALLERHAVDVMQATPSTWRLLIEAGWRGGRQWKALCGGEALPVDVADALLGRVGELWNMYGPTETTVWSTCARIEAGQGEISIGRPIANTQVWVLDEHANLLPVGVAGELYIGGEGVALGYHGRPELTAERFVADPFSARAGARLYRTGDLGRWRSDGQLQHLGRSDLQVKVRGHRIELGEIEAALAGHPALARAVVAVREDAPGDVRLVAYVVPRDAQPDAAALRAYLAKSLPDYMLPQHFVPLAALPLTANGKVDRRALPAPVLVAADPAATAVELPRNELEAQVAASFRQALSLPQLGVNDDFFALGGHSLLAAQMAMRLGREIGCVVPMGVVFEHPTVAALAAWLGRQAPATDADAAIPRRSASGPAPLSLMQQRIWYLEQLHPRRTVFNVPSAHRLRGELDANALGKAFAGIVERQAVLRTRIATVEGEPSQVVLDSVDTAIPLEDLSGVAGDERQALLMRRLERECALPFDIARAPLFRARLFRLATDDHVLFFMPHHVIWDGWSFDLFYEEMSALYDAHRHSRAPALAPLPVDYADFSAWQRDWMKGSTLDRQLEYWRTKLAGAPQALELPTDRPRPTTQSGDGGTAWLRLPRATTEALRDLGVREGATLFMTLLSVWALLLHRLSGQREVMVGTPVRGRNLPELERLMGFFVNAVPLRLAIDSQHDFLELLRAVRAEVIEAFNYQDVPFEHLVRVLGAPRDQSRFPIYQAFFSYQDARQRPSRWGDLRHENVPVFQPAAAQDLALWFLDGADGLVGGLNYNSDVFDAATAEQLCVRFSTMLDTLVREPRKSIRDLLAPGAEELALLRQWNDTTVALPAAQDITSYVDLESRDPGTTAIAWIDEEVTYGELARDVGRIAATLADRGVGAGDVVALHLDRSPRMVAALLGALAAGATYLPLDPEFPPERLAFMLADSGARLVITDHDVPAPGWDASRVLRLDESALANAPAGAGSRAKAARGDAAYLIYTSGSTGKPKGVKVSHGCVVNFLHAMQDRPGLASGAKLAAVTTISFDIAVLELLLPLSVGAQVVLATREQATDGHALRALLERHAVDVMQATPSTWRLLIEAGWRGGRQWKALCGGEALPVDVADALLGRVGELWNMYGPTETTVWSTCARIEAGQGEISIGRPIANTQVWVLDEHANLLPVGVAGELYIGGEGVALGYHGRPELTAERFVADPFSARVGARLYRTGDLGRWRSDGQLQHLGRSDLQVKVRGYRIELGEIELALMRRADIEQAVVVATSAESGDPRLVAYVVARAGAEPTPAMLRESLRTELPEYMVPATYVPLPALPLTPNGKLDRRALPAPGFVEVARTRGSLQPPLTPAEQVVAQVWCELLGIEDVGAQDTFLDLGGHSLLIMRAVAMLETRTGVRLSPRAFVFQTLGQIAAEYDRARTEAASSAPVPAQATANAPLGRALRRVLGFLRPKRRP